MIKLDLNIINADAERCLMCKVPRCKNNCPINTDIPKVIELYKENKISEAGELLFKNNPLSVVCSIVCPHENQCSGNCIRGIKGEPIKFGAIEHYISMEYLKNMDSKDIKKNGIKIAIIGSGPAGIAIAFILAERGYDITIFESKHKLGGVMRYGIPEYRLPNSILDLIEEKLIDLGVKIKYNTLVGPVVTLDRLLEDGYKSVFIGTGVWNPKTLNIKGEMSGHVNYAINYLMSPESFRLGKKVIVIGAGNVAMDAARVAKRSGCEVTVVYRKGFEEMTATKLEIREAQEDGVEFTLFKSPVEILDNGVKFISVEKSIGEDGRAVFKTVEGSEEIIECDSVIIAVSQSPKNNIVANTDNLATSRGGLLAVDEYGHTTKKGVFASGDVVTGAKTVVEAAANAKKVADAMDEYCKE
ncbi:MAG: NAD(P)-dependent oxidoreductase [Clostridium sp.]|nr:NAD(P)-dependent oxidoreductase [Clostridium sp.]MDU7084127.1 NAD(P)-dependent oxidoreductase [Clostridium sp.]